MKKKKHVTPRAVAAPKHAAKPNPFELKGSKRKFDVLGKRDKDGKKNVIKSREEAVNKVRSQALSRNSNSGSSSAGSSNDGSSGTSATTACMPAIVPVCNFNQLLSSTGSCLSALLTVQRKKTLLVEYKQLRKANTFIDRRFGGEHG
jgi:hypothetical protein